MPADELLRVFLRRFRQRHSIAPFLLLSVVPTRVARFLYAAVAQGKGLLRIKLALTELFEYRM